eukprot:scaffold43992_cov252-Amphora_coffeaeformis.AAC.2
MTRDLLNWFAVLRVSDAAVDVRDLPLEHDNARAPFLSERLKTCTAITSHHHHQYKKKTDKKRPLSALAQARVHNHTIATTTVWHSPSISHHSSSSHGMAWKNHSLQSPSLIGMVRPLTTTTVNAPKPERHQSSEELSPAPTTLKICVGDRKLSMPVRKASVCWEDLCGISTTTTMTTTTIITSSNSSMLEGPSLSSTTTTTTTTASKTKTDMVVARRLQNTISEDESSSSEHTAVE